MTVQEAIAQAEAILPGRAAPEGEIDPRWQAVIAVAEFIESDPEAVWSFVRQWDCSADQDLRMAIATCALEHLLEYHFDLFIDRVNRWPARIVVSLNPHLLLEIRTIKGANPRGAL